MNEMLLWRDRMYNRDKQSAINGRGTASVDERDRRAAIVLRRAPDRNQQLAKITKLGGGHDYYKGNHNSSRSSTDA